MQSLNPLDNVEDVLRDNNWVFTRMSDERLQLEIRGSSCDYNIMFFWQDSLNALQLVCIYDLNFENKNLAHAYRTLNSMNSSLMMGHFELDENTMRPSYRHNCFMKRDDIENIETFVDLSLLQCEHSLPLFELLAGDQAISDDMISFALMDTQGES